MPFVFFTSYHNNKEAEDLLKAAVRAVCARREVEARDQVYLQVVKLRAAWFSNCRQAATRLVKALAREWETRPERYRIPSVSTLTLCREEDYTLPPNLLQMEGPIKQGYLYLFGTTAHDEYLLWLDHAVVRYLDSNAKDTFFSGFREVLHGGMPLFIVLYCVNLKFT